MMRSILPKRLLLLLLCIGWIGSTCQEGFRESTENQQENQQLYKQSTRWFRKLSQTITCLPGFLPSEKDEVHHWYDLARQGAWGQVVTEANEAAYKAGDTMKRFLFQICASVGNCAMYKGPDAQYKKSMVKPVYKLIQQLGQAVQPHAGSSQADQIQDFVNWAQQEWYPDWKNWVT